MFIRYASNSAVYRFLVLKNDDLESNTIIEMKNAEFFNIFFHFLRNFGCEDHKDG